MQSQGYHLFGLTDMVGWLKRLECCHGGTQVKVGRRGGVVALYGSEQLECVELCWGMDEEPTESLWVGIKERTGKDVIVGICYRPP